MLKDDTNYKRVYETLRKEILGGKYSSGKSFPSSTALARRFELTRFTIRQALGILAKEGFIRSQRGRGTFVTKQGSARKIGLIVPSISNFELFPRILSALARLSHETGYELVFRDVYSVETESRKKEVRQLAKSLVEGGVAGVIFQPMDYSLDNGDTNREILAAFDRAGIPVVLFDSDIVPPPSRSAYDLVSIDNLQAGEELALYMIDRGAKRVCYAMRPSWWPNEMIRLRGVCVAVTSRGHRWTSDNVMVTEPDDLATLRKRMSKRIHPDAFVCTDDDMAAKLLLSMGRLGYDVPGDVMLAGIDDVRIAGLTSPSLTTIHQPCEELARAVFDRIVDRISRPQLFPVRVELPVSLVVRQSTR